MLRRFTKTGRVLEPEWLDSAPPSAAERNLCDLARINRWFGGHNILLRVLKELAHPREKFSVLDVGAASGDMGRCLLRKYRNATVLSLDRKAGHLRHAAPPKIVACAPELPFRDRSFDIVLCSLVLHHYPEEGVVELLSDLRRLARRAVVIIDLERRSGAYAFLPFTRWVLRWSDMTVHDGCASVAAGFRPSDLAELAKRPVGSHPKVRRHWPWFRISVVIPSGGWADSTAAEMICSQNQATVEEA